MTARIVFQSEAGEACCVAVDPELLGDVLVVLDNLPPGPATVTFAGFATEFAPAVPGISDTCETIPAEAAQPCDPQRQASPAFSSDPIVVTIVAGAQTNVTDVMMRALPFLFEFSPAQGETAAPPIPFALTVVDAITGIDRDSVALEVTFNEGGLGPPTQLVTRRVALELTACADGTAAPCSPNGDLELTGFRATGVASEISGGPVVARVTAENLGDPSRRLDFVYSFSAMAPATATATAANTGTATNTGTPAATSTATATNTATARDTPTRISTATSTVTATSRNTPTRTSTATSTVTATATSTPTPRPPTSTPTATRDPNCPATPLPNCRQPIEARKALLSLRNSADPDGDKLTWRWRRGAATDFADFGFPIAFFGPAYAFCIYDQTAGSPHLFFSAVVPPGRTCGVKPCWKSTGDTLLTYDDSTGDAGGIQKITLKPGPRGQAEITVKGGGPNLELVTARLVKDPTVIVQLRHTGDECWEARYSTFTRNQPSQFVAKSDAPTR